MVKFHKYGNIDGYLLVANFLWATQSIHTNNVIQCSINQKKNRINNFARNFSVPLLLVVLFFIWTVLFLQFFSLLLLVHHKTSPGLKIWSNINANVNVQYIQFEERCSLRWVHTTATGSYQFVCSVCVLGAFSFPWYIFDRFEWWNKNECPWINVYLACLCFCHLFEYSVSMVVIIHITLLNKSRINITLTLCGYRIIFCLASFFRSLFLSTFCDHWITPRLLAAL